MSKSYAEMADEILNGALSNPVKNPYDPAVGHQAHMPAMDPNDTLLEMTDSQRNQLMGLADETPKNEPLTETQTSSPAPTLSEAKRIIEKIQEATTVGTIGVNMAGPSGDAKAVKLPGDTKPQPKKRAKKKAKPKNESYDFLSYLKA
jgi:hypothetical protein